VNTLIAWFARNHIAANLFMGLLIAGGLLALPSIPQKTFPDIDVDIVLVTVAYRGAAPEESEVGACLRVEEAIDGVVGIERIRSTAAEGGCSVIVELLTSADAGEALDEIKNRVDSINTFPKETEKPVIAQVAMRHPVIDVALVGDADERTLKVLAQRTRDEIASLPGITLAEVANTREYEISIEVPEASLRRHGLTFDDVARAVRRSSLDLPGGSIKTDAGEILVRTKGQAYTGPEFEDIVVITRADGTRVTLGEVAQVIDGFAETDQALTFDGKSGAVVRVYRVGDQHVLDLAEVVREYVAEAQTRMPAGVDILVWRDGSEMLSDRLDTLMRTGLLGILLVLLVLALFLRPRLSFWVSLGIPISLLGTLGLFPLFGLSIDGISVFGFILVLGILVDDAIVIGEAVHTEQQRDPDGGRLEPAIRGTTEVATPVVFGVLTTIVAFSPLIFTPGHMGQILGIVGLTVMLCLVFSLIESQWILPAHLGHGRERGNTAEVSLMLIPVVTLAVITLTPDTTSRVLAALGILAFLYVAIRLGWLQRFSDGVIRVQTRFSDALERFVSERYRPFVERSVEWRYFTVAIALTSFIVTLGVLGSGRITFDFFAASDSDTISAQVTLPQGVPIAVTARAIEELERSAAIAQAHRSKARPSCVT